MQCVPTKLVMSHENEGFSSLVINMWRYLDGVPPPKKEKHDNEGTHVNTEIF